MEGKTKDKPSEHAPKPEPDTFELLAAVTQALVHKLDLLRKGWADRETSPASLPPGRGEVALADSVRSERVT